MFLILKISLMITFMSVFYFFCSPRVMVSIDSFMLLYPPRSSFVTEFIFDDELIRLPWPCGVFIPKSWVELLEVFMTTRESFFISSSFSRFIYYFCCPLTSFNVIICYWACFRFFVVILYVISPPYKQTPSAWSLCLSISLTFSSSRWSFSSIGMLILFFLRRASSCSTLLDFFSRSYSVSLVIRS